MCFFLRYKISVKDYIVINIKTRKIFIFKNVIFYQVVHLYNDNKQLKTRLDDNPQKNSFD